MLPAQAHRRDAAPLAPVGGGKAGDVDQVAFVELHARAFIVGDVRPLATDPRRLEQIFELGGSKLHKNGNFDCLSCNQIRLET